MVETHGEAQADQLMQELVKPLHGTGLVQVPTADWHREIIDRHNAVVASGEGATCPHVRASDGALLAAAWLPGLMVCRGCATMSLEPVDKVESWTCNRCGQHRPGQIAVSALQSRHVVILVGLCRECRKL